MVNLASKALDEMRRLLGVMRAPVDIAERARTPASNQLSALIDEHRSLGGDVPLQCAWPGGRPASGRFELIGYRVVQEALTNVRRHADGAAVEVFARLHCQRCCASPYATMDPVAPSDRRTKPRRPGFGLVGMRERVEAIGGTFSAGDHVEGGFEIVSDLPVDKHAVMTPIRVDHRRRSGDRALRLRRATRHPRRHHGCRHRPRRGGRGGRGHGPPTRRDPDGRTHAGGRRHQGDPDDHPSCTPTTRNRATTFDLDEYVYDALSAGASGFLLKDVTAETLFDAVRVVAAGDALLTPNVTRRLIDEFVRIRPRHTVDGIADLTAREVDVVWLIATLERSNAEIATDLFVSNETIKTHVSRILAKLDARDRTQAVIAAYQSGLVQPG